MYQYKLPKDPVKDTFLLNNLFANRESYGVTLESIGDNQLCYEVLLNLYENMPYNKEYVLFSQDWTKPYLHIPTALFHIEGIAHYRGNIVTTSLSALNDAKRFNHFNSISYWLVNIVELEGIPGELLKKLFQNVNVVLRGEYQRNFLQNVGIDPTKYKVMENFNIKEFAVGKKDS